MSGWCVHDGNDGAARCGLERAGRCANDDGKAMVAQARRGPWRGRGAVEVAV
jgi:hypothetical protein